VSARGGEPVGKRVSGEMARRRADLRLPYPVLAQRTGIEKARLQRLLNPNGLHVRLDELARLCEALQISPGDLARLLWPERRITDSHAELELLRSELRTLQLRTASGAEESAWSRSPTGEMVRALASAGGWAYSMLPVHAGPSAAVTVHAADRFAVTPRDGRTGASAHEELRRRFLHDVRGLPTGVTFHVWRAGNHRRESLPHDPFGRHAFDGSPEVLYLQAAVFSADRPAGDNPVHLAGAAEHSIVVLALREISDRLALSALLARALGWGLTSTDRSGHSINSQVVGDPRAQAKQANLYANLVLGEFLTASPAHTVISHAGTPVVDDAGRVVEDHALFDGDLTTAPFVVLLSESDTMLRRALSRPVNSRGDLSRFSLSQLTGWRDQLRDTVKRLQAEGRGVIVDVDPSWTRSPDLDGSRESRLRWQASCAHGRFVLQELLHASGRFNRSGLAIRDPAARALLSYESPLSWH
jgi:DNA-binding Xre family transcriptional regulator